MLIENMYCLIKYVYWFSTAYVLVKILMKIWVLTKDYILPNFKDPQDFKQYGQWAVLTGSTDGIGKEFAKQLASKGLDICLISRNEDKLRNTAKEIEDKYGVKTKYIIADFTDPNIYNQISENLTELDIGILVNNVGMLSDRAVSYSRLNGQLIKDYINVNMLSAAMMTSLILPHMTPKKRGLIINLSSIAGEVTSPYLTIYSSTKAFMSMFGCNLSYELKRHNIQVKTFTPGFVSTNMVHQYPKTDKLARSIPYAMPDVQRYVQSALLSLNSNTIKSCGYFSHEIFLMLLSINPTEIISTVLNKLYRPTKNRQ